MPEPGETIAIVASRQNLVLAFSNWYSVAKSEDWPDREDPEAAADELIRQLAQL